MFKNIATGIATMAFVMTSHTAYAGPLGNSSNLQSILGQDTGNIVRVHKKRCKFYHPDGHTYKDHCPHGLKKGSRKKRALLGALAGSAAGAIAGGGRGAAIGAGAGAAIGAASLRRCWYFVGDVQVKVKCRQN